MIKDLLKLYSEETLIYLENKMNNKVSIRPSVIFSWLLVFFYLTSRVDLFPEALVKPAVLAFIDDILIIGLVLWYTLVSQDVKELKSEKQLQRFYRPKCNTKDSVSIPEPANQTNSDDGYDGNSGMHVDSDSHEILPDDDSDFNGVSGNIPADDSISIDNYFQAGPEGTWGERNIIE